MKKLGHTLGLADDANVKDIASLIHQQLKTAATLDFQVHALESKLESANAITSDLIDGINARETFLNSMEGKNESATEVGGKRDPRFDLSKYLCCHVYDNIQRKHAKTTESGAGSTSRGVEVRTMRIVLKFDNPEYAALQTDFKYWPAFMSQKFPLSEVPANSMKLSDVADDLQLSRQTLHRELICQFLLEKFRDSALPAEDIDLMGKLEGFLKGEDLSERDDLFDNAVFISRVLSAAAMFRKTMRDNMGSGNAFAIDAATKFFVPLFYQFGFKNYGPFSNGRASARTTVATRRFNKCCVIPTARMDKASIIILKRTSSG